MLDSLWKDTIESRVQKVVAQRVASAQKEHDDECDVINKEAEAKIEAHAEKMVLKVLGQ